MVCELCPIKFAEEVEFMTSLVKSHYNSRNDSILDFAEGGTEDHHGVGKAANVNLNKRITFLDMYLSHLNKSVSRQDTVLWYICFLANFFYLLICVLFETTYRLTRVAHHSWKRVLKFSAKTVMLKLNSFITFIIMAKVIEESMALRLIFDSLQHLV